MSESKEIPRLSHNKLLVALLVLLVLYFIVFFRYLRVRDDFRRLKTVTPQVLYADDQAFMFLNLFVNGILRREGPIDYGTQTALSNIVENLDDSQLTAMWEDFLLSSTEKEAQASVKEILGRITALLSER